ncbi:MAG TPA: hypothetical protein VIK55_07885 [Paludibacter sp.]
MKETTNDWLVSAESDLLLIREIIAHEIAMTKKSQTEMNWNEVEICEANISPGYSI